LLYSEAFRHYIPHYIEKLYAILKRGKREQFTAYTDLYKKLVSTSFKLDNGINHLLVRDANTLNTTLIYQKIINILQHATSLFAPGLGIPAHHYGLIPSSPFSDVRIIELAIAMPPEKWLFNGQRRGLIREATKGILPELVRQRKTKGYVIDEERAYFESQLEHYIDSLPNTTSKLWQFVNKKEFVACLESYRNKPDDLVFRISDTLIQLFYFVNFKHHSL